jgi:acetyl esterase
MRLFSAVETRLHNRNPPPVGATYDRSIPGPESELPVRIYRPTGEGPFSTVVFFHGGAYIMGGLDSHDLLCRHLTRESGCVVVAVDYRLAPEHQFPAAVEDAYAAVEWAARHADALANDGQLAVAGDSAGGTLAAITTLLARDRDGPEIDYQALAYPSIGVDESQQSVQDHAGAVLDEDDLRWIQQQYFGSEIHLANPYADPANACDLSGLPPATIVTAGFDPLRDGAVEYADRLEADRVPVCHRNYDDMIHGFLTMLSASEDVERAHEAVAAIGTDLTQACHRGQIPAER